MNNPCPVRAIRHFVLTNEVHDPSDQGSVALFSEPTVARRMRLKTQHNQQAPISRLPEETLYKVFLCIANARLDHGQRVYDHWWKQWRNGTQICTQWRFVGLGSPRLWSIIIATKERKEVEFYLRHSKNCPLTVEIAPFSAEEKSIVSSILQHLPRIQDLSFWRCDDHLDVLLPLLAAGCPLLERVDLVSHNHVSLGPLITFGQQTPALKQLQLHFIYPSWETAQIRGLTDLTIGFSAGSYRPTLECFFELLRECPDLEHLTLELDQRLVRSSPASGPSVPLRRLCWVHFFAPSIACAEFLDGLILSNKITMDMRSTLRLSEGPIRIFPRHFLPSASISDNIALHLHLHGCAEPHFYDITIKFISASSGTNITHLYEGIYLRGKTSMDAFMKVGLTLTDIHLMECISSLKIKCSSGLKGAVESETWRRFLIRMPQLKNLEVKLETTYTCIPRFTSALMPDICTHLLELFWDERPMEPLVWDEDDRPKKSINRSEIHQRFNTIISQRKAVYPLRRVTIRVQPHPAGPLFSYQDENDQQPPQVQTSSDTLPFRNYVRQFAFSR